MNPQFETAEDVDREYDRRIHQEQNPVERSKLQVEAARAKVELELRAKNQELVNNWKELALYKFPEAAAFPQLITGTTEHEILQSAEAAHNRVVEIRRGTSGMDPIVEARQQAQEFYGRGSTVGGASSTGTPAGFATTDTAALRQERQFAEKFNSAPRDAYGQRMGISPAEITEYTNSRFFDHVRNAIQYWGMMTNSSYANRRR